MDRFLDKDPVQLYPSFDKRFSGLTVCLEASVLYCVHEHGFGGVHADGIRFKRGALLQKMRKHTGPCPQVRELSIRVHFQMPKSLLQHPVPVAIS